MKFCFIVIRNYKNPSINREEVGRVFLKETDVRAHCDMLNSVSLDYTYTYIKRRIK